MIIEEMLGMKALFLFLAGNLAVLSAFAQSNKIEADRPSETVSTSIAEKDYIQAEVGFRKEQEKGDDYSLFHPRAQLRYGLAKSFELRAEISSQTERLFSENEFKYGLAPVELGLKAKLLEGKKGALPATSFYAQFGIPAWASKDHEEEHVFPKLRMLFENKLSDKIKLSYNAGAEWQGDDSGPQWLYTISPQFELGKSWEAFLETYAYLQKGAAAQQHIDGGFAFYPGKNIKLDLWGGEGLSKEALAYFVSLGVSFRLKP